MPRVSHPVVHPDPAPAPAPAAAAAAPALGQGQGQGQIQGANAVNAPPGVLMRGPNPRVLVGIRLVQALFPAVAVAAMASARDFTSVTPFRYLVSAAALQCLWSLAGAILEFYALLVGRSFGSPRAIAIRCVGDWITGALIFSAACASASITVFLDFDMMVCYENQCPRFMAATAMAFLSWFAVAPFCFGSLHMVVYKLQRP